MFFQNCLTISNTFQEILHLKQGKYKTHTKIYHTRIIVKQSQRENLRKMWEMEILTQRELSSQENTKVKGTNNLC